MRRPTPCAVPGPSAGWDNPGVPLPFDPPVVLAPMAGITNRAFRALCREASVAATGAVAGLYVSEMVTSRALVERNAETMDLVAFHPDESPRSVQLYGVDPDVIGAAVRILVDEDRADHVDLNFGCPVPKVTRKGGGSALPWKRDLFRQHRAPRRSTAADGRVPVSVKMRTGIDDDHLTYLEAGRAAADAGVAWVALHGRTAAQMYSGTADWEAIARLKEELAPSGIPVLGNGDIWTAEDALRMMASTGCRRRGRRPGLPGPAVAVRAAGRGLRGARRCRPTRTWRACSSSLRRHAHLLVADYGELQGLPRHPQAHGLVPEGLHGAPAGPAGAGHGGQPRRARRSARADRS